MPYKRPALFFYNNIELSPRAHKVASLLEACACPDKNYYKGLLDMLPSCSGMSKRTIQRGIRELIEADLIKRGPITDDGVVFFMPYLEWYGESVDVTSDADDRSVQGDVTSVTPNDRSVTPVSLHVDDLDQIRKNETRSVSDSVGLESYNPIRESEDLLLENGVYPALAERISKSYPTNWVTSCVSKAKDIQSASAIKIRQLPGVIKFLVKGGNWQLAEKEEEMAIGDLYEHSENKKPKKTKANIKINASIPVGYQVRELPDWNTLDFTYYTRSLIKKHHPDVKLKAVTKRQPSQFKWLFQSKDVTNEDLKATIDYLFANWEEIAEEKKLADHPHVGIVVGFYDMLRNRALGTAPVKVEKPTRGARGDYEVTDPEQGF